MKFGARDTVRDNERGFELTWDDAIQAADLYVRDSPVGNGPAN